ncbi:hypothetical protein M409DRAFT_52267 [Zasmidium cellare ATCC 36951]|uniref:Uncharacterized protein n=1 Tax=Zasmidium cellare ATCC 36951 TaxID=1080233 RepID=A0A6A6CST9_ZASCE|nr:uncharacterized protein M409DRAFT_52267 [Zasmidium cellare ATCC 36951]KAF2169763.1 hypothetical protein M409DRAFT_52267 [Zasmidium cellare ATCC 36951]
MDDVPHDRILQLMRYVGNIGGPPGRRLTAKDIREAVTTWAEGKDSRMSPWGIQFQHPDPNTGFVPPIPYQDSSVICGRWIRDVEVPEEFSGHPVECTCHGRPPPKMTFADTPSWVPSVLQAFQHDEVTDASLEMAESLPKTTLLESPSGSCLFMELPPEILELILEYLVPTGQTYHFLPARNGKNSVQVVQKFVPDGKRTGTATSKHAPPTAPLSANQSPAPNSMQSIQMSNPKHPATGSTYMSLAGTCKYFQDIVYSRLFSQNDFVFNLTPYTIHSAIRSCDFKNFRCWTRTTAHSPKALGPLTARAAKYLKHVTLIASLPFSHSSLDIKALTALFSDTASTLFEAQLSHLALALNLAKPGSNDNRFALQALPVDLLQAEVKKDGLLSLNIREPKVDPVRESNKTQRVFAPLLQGPKGVKEVKFNGPLSEGFVGELKSALMEEQV